MEKEIKVSYSASNDKSISAGEFTITIYSPLKDKDIMSQISNMVVEQIDLEGINSLTITIKN